MEMVKHPVNDRCEDDAHHGDEHQSGVQRINAREELTRLAQALGLDRPHAAEKHGRIQECIEPRHMLVMRVANDSDKQRDPDQGQCQAGMDEHTQRKLARWYRWYVVWFVHEPGLCSLRSERSPPDKRSLYRNGTWHDPETEQARQRLLPSES